MRSRFFLVSTDPGDVIDQVFGAISELITKLVGGLFAAILSIFATVYAVIVAVAFDSVLAFERALASFGLIHPIFGWTFFGALGGAVIGLWRQLPRYGLEAWRWPLAMLPGVFLVMGLLLDSGRQGAEVIAVPTDDSSIAVTAPPMALPSMALPTAREHNRLAPAHLAKHKQTPTVGPHQTVHTVADVMAHTRDKSMLLAKGSEIEVLEEKGNWLKVRVVGWDEIPSVYIDRTALIPIVPVDPRQRIP